ncbi:MAG: hypothetical protein DRO09_00170 [Thermoprotei archaeon]|nr:MAG: hypothetical protein DRO09_00170 [Thermoprotei archaeon]
MSYPAAYARARGRAKPKDVFLPGYTLTTTYVGGGVEVKVSDLSKVYGAIAQEIASGYVAVATGFSGNAFKLKLFYLPDPTTYSGTTGHLTEVASGTNVSGVTLNILAFGE